MTDDVQTPHAAAYLSIADSFRSVSTGLLILIVSILGLAAFVVYVEKFDPKPADADAAVYAVVLVGLFMMGMAALTLLNFSQFQCYAIVAFVPGSRRLLNVAYACPIVVTLLMMTMLLIMAVNNAPFKPEHSVVCCGLFYSSQFAMWGFFALFASRVAAYLRSKPHRQATSMVAWLYFSIVGLMALALVVFFLLLEPRPAPGVWGAKPKYTLQNADLVLAAAGCVTVMALGTSIYAAIVLRRFADRCEAEAVPVTL